VQCIARAALIVGPRLGLLLAFPPLHLTTGLLCLAASCRIGQVQLVHIACTVFDVRPGVLLPRMVEECEDVLRAALAPPCLAMTTRLQQTMKLVVRAAALRQVRAAVCEWLGTCAPGAGDKGSGKFDDTPYTQQYYSCDGASC
jgi:hypothetical protein